MYLLIFPHLYLLIYYTPPGLRPLPTQDGSFYFILLQAEVDSVRVQ